MTTTIDVATDIRARVDGLDWKRLENELDNTGHAVTVPVLTEDECGELSDLFDGGRFRSTIDMARYRFGDGRYRYFDHPLPDTIAALRASFYRHLAPIANHWTELLRGDGPKFPLEHEELLRRCHAAGQTRSTPLILRYGPETGTRSTRTSTATCSSRSRCSRSCRVPARTSKADSSSCSSSAPAPRAGRTCSSRRGAVRNLPDCNPPEPRQERLPPRRHAPRRVHGDPRTAHRARDHLSRRYLRSINSPSRSATGIGSTTSSCTGASGSRFRNPSRAQLPSRRWTSGAAVSVDSPLNGLASPSSHGPVSVSPSD